MTTVERHRIRVSDQQRAFVECPAKFDAFVAGIGSGKTMAGAIKAVGEIRKGGLGIVVCPTFRMLRDATWRTCLEVWRDRLKITDQILRGDELRVIFDNGAEAIFRSAEDPDRLRGPNASWFMLDEGAQCHPDTWSILIGRLRGEGRTGRGWVTTTPRGMNFIYDIFVVRANADTHMHRASTADNPFLPREFEQSLRSQYDDKWAAQELDAEFMADDEDALIPYAWLDAARIKTVAYRPDGPPPIAGIDAAGEGTAENVMVIRQGVQILHTWAWADADAWDHCLRILREWRHRGLRQVNVDSAGIGWGLCRELTANGFDVTGINVGASPDGDEQTRERYLNLRAQLWWALRERFQDGDIAGLVDPLMFSQLASIHWDMNNPRRKIAIEKKSAALKRGVKSPDRAEALMLAFAPESQADRLARALAGQAV